MVEVVLEGLDGQRDGLSVRISMFSFDIIMSKYQRYNAAIISALGKLIKLEARVVYEIRLEEGIRTRYQEL